MEDFIEFLAKGIGAIMLIAFFVLLMTLPLYWLWNWLMPSIFGLREITLLQALGLNILSAILFKSSK